MIVIHCQEFVEIPSDTKSQHPLRASVKERGSFWTRLIFEDNFGELRSSRSRVRAPALPDPWWWEVDPVQIRMEPLNAAIRVPLMECWRSQVLHTTGGVISSMGISSTPDRRRVIPSCWAGVSLLRGVRSVFLARWQVPELRPRDPWYSSILFPFIFSFRLIFCQCWREYQQTLYQAWMGIYGEHGGSGNCSTAMFSERWDMGSNRECTESKE